MKCAIAAYERLEHAYFNATRKREHAICNPQLLIKWIKRKFRTRGSYTPQVMTLVKVCLQLQVSGLAD